MIFKRTKSGLTNLHRFYENADVVVYLEGGPSIALDEIAEGEHHEASSDIRFWQQLFSIYQPTMKVKFKSVGSKTIVRSIAADIADGQVGHTVAAMDRDFDDLLNRKIVNPNVLYTWGYSWENDSWSVVGVARAALMFTGNCPTSEPDAIKEGERLFENFERVARHGVRAEFVLAQQGGAFFDRRKFQRYIQTEPEPSIKLAQIKESFVWARSKHSRPVRGREDAKCDFARDCFGHLLAGFAYRVLCHLIDYLGATKFPNCPKEYATAMVTSNIRGVLEDGHCPEIKEHYKTTFERMSS